MFDLLYFVLGGFNECGLVVDEVFQRVDKLPHLPGGDPAGAFRGLKASPLRVCLFRIRDLMVLITLTAGNARLNSWSSFLGCLREEAREPCRSVRDRSAFSHCSVSTTTSECTWMPQLLTQYTSFTLYHGQEIQVSCQLDCSTIILKISLTTTLSLNNFQTLARNTLI